LFSLVDQASRYSVAAETAANPNQTEEENLLTATIAATLLKKQKNVTNAQVNGRNCRNH